MLTLDLATLERRRTLDVLGSWSPDEVGLPGSDLELSEPVGVALRARLTATGQILVEGELATTLGHVCRRCLEPVSVPFAVQVAILYVAEGEADPDDDEVRTFDPQCPELELAEALREEIALSAPLYAECRPDCRGLCPRCGANRNETNCDCSVEEPDPRWEVLRALTGRNQ